MIARSNLNPNSNPNQTPCLNPQQRVCNARSDLTLTRLHTYLVKARSLISVSNICRIREFLNLKVNFRVMLTVKRLYSWVSRAVLDRNFTAKSINQCLNSLGNAPWLGSAEFCSKSLEDKVFCMGRGSGHGHHWSPIRPSVP